MLKNLEVSGFKSFAKKTALEFNTPITAVVGPNGSGKSNILEAFRFVLGEQSIKSMRGKKSEDLIWNGGGQGGSRSNRASVKIVFDNRKRLFNLDFDEVSIERVVYRDSVSEYLINGSQVRLKDVLEMLSGAHIGPSGHHIISQGEADRILSAGGKERKEMIEDALGLKIYQYKKKESERKLERAEENVKSAESLRREIAPHLRFLKKQVEKVERSFALKEELKTVFADYLEKESLYAFAVKKSSSAEKETALRKMRDLEKDLQRAKEETKSAVPEEKTEELFSLQRKYGELRSRKEALEREVGNTEGQISVLERRQSERKKRELENRQIPAEAVEELIHRAEEKLSDAEKGLIGTVGALVAGLRDIFRRFLGDENIFRRVGEDESEEIARLLEVKRNKEDELGKIKAEESDMAGKEKKLVAEIQAEKEKNLSAEKEIFRLTATQKEIYAELRQAEANEARAKSAEENLSREIEDAKAFLGLELLQILNKRQRPEDGHDAKMPSEADMSEQVERRRKIERLKAKIEEVGGIGGDEVMKEFKDTSERDSFLEKEIGDLHQSIKSLKNLIIELNAKIEEDFKVGIEKINGEFDALFKLMFGGGHASIKVVYEKVRERQPEEVSGEDEAVGSDEEEDVEKIPGIVIDIQLPRKKIKGLEMLSGGERALTSIALLFAISQVNPPPFVILDETDAALDEANSSKYGNMIENLSKHSQLILITHNRETMSRAGVLYGVTMDKDGVSKILSIAFEEAVLVAK